jgi:hypothetical protein
MAPSSHKFHAGRGRRSFLRRNFYVARDSRSVVIRQSVNGDGKAYPIDHLLGQLLLISPSELVGLVAIVVEEI